MKPAAKNRSQKPPGRAAAGNPPSRFERLEVIPTEEALQEEQPAPQTEFYKDTARSIIAYNDSPDVPFDAGINPYRGCEHGCIYCYARPTHEYFGLSGGLDFETRIFVKEDAPKLLRKELSSRKWKPQPIALSGNTDPYQPVERHLKLTRGCLEVLAEFANPVGVITKNYLVTRDIDILQQLAKYRAAAVAISVTTLNARLARLMEPRTSGPRRRLEAIRRLSQAGIPTTVLVAPVIPGLNDHEIPAIIEAAAAHGVQSAAYVMIRLPFSVGPLFEEWLERHFPDRKEKVLNRIREVRGGKLYESRFHLRMRGQGVYAGQVDQLFKTACRKNGLRGGRSSLSAASFRRPGEKQLNLF